VPDVVFPPCQVCRFGLYKMWFLFIAVSCSFLRRDFDDIDNAGADKGRSCSVYGRLTQEQDARRRTVCGLDARYGT
jgi:hypothetical protein